MPICDTCGAHLPDGITCEDDFLQFLYWEFENPELLPAHHLMVLCYHIQHPHLYSEEALKLAHQLLKQFVTTDITPEAMRERMKALVDSSKRQNKIRGTTNNHGRYPYLMPWTTHARDVVLAGPACYVGSIHAWAQSVFKTLVLENILA